MGDSSFDRAEALQALLEENELMRIEVSVRLARLERLERVAAGAVEARKGALPSGIFRFLTRGLDSAALLRMESLRLEENQRSLQEARLGGADGG